MLLKAPPHLVQLCPGLGWLWTEPRLEPLLDPGLDLVLDVDLEGGSGTGLGSESRHQQHHIL